MKESIEDVRNKDFWCNLPEPSIPRHLNKIYRDYGKDYNSILRNTLNSIVSMIYENAIGGHTNIEIMINNDVSKVVINRFRELNYRVSKNKPYNGLVDIRISWKR